MKLKLQNQAQVVTIKLKSQNKNDHELRTASWEMYVNMRFKLKNYANIN